MSLRGLPVLVTGAGGFLGSVVARRLASTGAGVHALLRPGSDDRRIKDLRGLQVLRADLSEPEAINAVVRSCSPAAVFHAAGPRGHLSAKDQQLGAIKDCIAGTRNLLTALEDCSVKAMVCAGSLYEYGPSRRPLTESSAIQPVTFRGVVKAAASMLCLQWGSSASVPVTVARLSTVYGPRDHTGRLVLRAINAAFSGDPLPLTGSTIGRDYIYCKDAADAMIRAAEFGGSPRILNLGSGRLVSNVNLVRIVEAVTGRPVRTVPGAYPLKDFEEWPWVAGSSAARRVLEWQPKYSLRRGLEETVEWARSVQVWANG